MSVYCTYVLYINTNVFWDLNSNPFVVICSLLLTSITHHAHAYDTGYHSNLTAAAAVRTAVWNFNEPLTTNTYDEIRHLDNKYRST